MDPLPPQVAIMHIISGFWLSRAVYLAARLRLADAIGDGSASLAQIAAKTNTREAPLRRLMRALTAHGIFATGANGTFTNTPLSEILRANHPGGLRGLAEAELGHDHYASWGDIEFCLRHDGTAFENMQGMPIWRYYAEHPDAEALFAEAMSNFTAVAHAGILGSYAFPPFRRAIDVGGGHGAFLHEILADHPDASGILFDLPTVLAARDPTAFDAVITARVTAVEGDFFVSVPTSGDLYVLKFILHDWTDQQNTAILGNIRRAITPGGRLVIIEIVLPQEDQPHLGPLMDLNMMVMTGGIERTEDEFRALLSASGFHLDRVMATKSPFSVLEAVPI